MPASSQNRATVKPASWRITSKGPWPAPKRREMAAVVRWLALRYPAWGYRKIWAMAVARGYRCR